MTQVAKNLCRSWGNAAERLMRNPWFAYGGIFLLQLKVIWAMWLLRDLTTGDTSSYFSFARLWFENGRVNFPWSPLYTAFYGTLMHFTQDAYNVTILHRVIIVLGLALLVLALMRRLL